MWAPGRGGAPASSGDPEKFGDVMADPAGMPPATVRLASPGELSIAGGRHNQRVEAESSVSLDRAFMTAPIELSGRGSSVRMHHAQIVASTAGTLMVECAGDLEMIRSHVEGNVRCGSLTLCPRSTIRGDVSVEEKPEIFHLDGEIDGELSYFGEPEIDGRVKTLRLQRAHDHLGVVYLGPRAVVGTLIAPPGTIVGRHPWARLDTCPADVRVMSLDDAHDEFELQYPAEYEAE